jgi:threonine/homoserine/homoserine lactone efflux protein
VEIATVAVVAAVSTLWFLALALMFSAGRVRAAYLRLRRPIDALMGAALLGLGARLAAE